MKGRRKKNPIESSEHYLIADPPAELIGDIARARWVATIEVLDSENRKIPRSNEGVMIGYCSAFQLLADCERELQASGLLVANRDGGRRSPALAGKIQAMNAIRAFAAEIGLTPASASRLPLPPIAELPNPVADL
jgi:P27 family predicted phage terminase small subunit